MKHQSITPGGSPQVLSVKALRKTEKKVRREKERNPSRNGILVIYIDELLEKKNYELQSLMN